MNAVRASISVLSILFIAGCLVAQKHPPKSAIHRGDELATVTVVAFDARLGKVIEPPIIGLFKSEEDNKDYTRSFHQGTAESIPFGLYRMTAYLRGYISAERDIRVYQRHVTIVAGLGFALELSNISLNGRVKGLPASSANRAFVKLSGIYYDLSMESAITPEGEFGISGILPGKYLLLVVTGDGIVASRIVTIPDDGPTVEIEFGSRY